MNGLCGLKPFLQKRLEKVILPGKTPRLPGILGRAGDCSVD
jgi:hypothetical protein